MPAQIPLPFSLNPELDFEHFHPTRNEETVEHLRRMARGSDPELLVFIWGEAGSGRTHLLNAACREAHRSGLDVAYVPLGLIKDQGPGALEHLERLSLVCVDDLDAVAGIATWELALFALLNRLRDAQHRLIAAASVPPSDLPIRLPDLKTRLAWGLVLKLQPLTDADKLEVLQLCAKQMGLELHPHVGRYLLTHCPRDLPSLRRLIERLDHETLSAQRRLTIPFVKSVLEKPP